MGRLAEKRIKPVNFKFKQIEKNLYAAAWAMHKKFPMYEVDELVNAVWLIGDVQRVSDIKFVRKRAYYDMIQYIRTQRGYSFMRHRDSTGHFKEKTNRHEDYLHNAFQDNRKHDYFEDHLFDEDGSSDYEQVDNKEEAGRVLERLGKLNERYVDILRMYYYDGMTMQEIGDKLNRRLCTISITITRALETIKDCGFTFDDMRITDREKARGKQRKRQNTFWTPPEETEEELVDVLPEYVSDFEIDNDCAFDDSDLKSIKFCLDYEESEES